MYAVYEVIWTESERGWGTRPDGYSYHSSYEEAEKYIKKYWSSMPAAVPDEYSFPSEPVLRQVSKAYHDFILEVLTERTYIRHG